MCKANNEKIRKEEIQSIKKRDDIKCIKFVYQHFCNLFFSFNHNLFFRLIINVLRITYFDLIIALFYEIMIYLYMKPQNFV